MSSVVPPSSYPAVVTKERSNDLYQRQATFRAFMSDVADQYQYMQHACGCVTVTRFSEGYSAGSPRCKVHAGNADNGHILFVSRLLAAMPHVRIMPQHPVWSLWSVDKRCLQGREFNTGCFMPKAQPDEWPDFLVKSLANGLYVGVEIGGDEHSNDKTVQARDDKKEGTLKRWGLTVVTGHSDMAGSAELIADVMLALNYGRGRTLKLKLK